MLVRGPGIGPQLAAPRRAAGLTLADVVERTGIGLSTLSRLEAGHRRPTLELLLPLTAAYEVCVCVSSS